MIIDDTIVIDVKEQQVMMNYITCCTVSLSDPDLLSKLSEAYNKAVKCSGILQRHA